MNTQNRDNTIDITKGIGILLVIVGHTGGLPADTYIHHFIYSFHMPLFFILGGFLFKPSNIGYGVLCKQDGSVPGNIMSRLYGEITLLSV